MSILNMYPEQFNQQNASQNGTQTGENVPQTTYGQDIVQRLLSPQTSNDIEKEEYSKKMKIKRLRSQDLYFTEEQTLLNKEYHEKRRRIWRPMKAEAHFRNMSFRYLDSCKKKNEKRSDSKTQTTDKRTQNGHIGKRSQWFYQKWLCGLCLALSQTSIDGARNYTS